MYKSKENIQLFLFFLEMFFFPKINKKIIIIIITSVSEDAANYEMFFKQHDCFTVQFIRTCLGDFKDITQH